MRNSPVGNSLSRGKILLKSTDVLPSVILGQFLPALQTTHTGSQLQMACFGDDRRAAQGGVFARCSH